METAMKPQRMIIDIYSGVKLKDYNNYSNNNYHNNSNSYNNNYNDNSNNNYYSYYYYNYHYNYYYNNYYIIAGLVDKQNSPKVLFTIRESDAEGPIEFLNWIKKFNDRILEVAYTNNCKIQDWQNHKENA